MCEGNPAKVEWLICPDPSCCVGTRPVMPVPRHTILSATQAQLAREADEQEAVREQQRQQKAEDAKLQAMAEEYMSSNHKVVIDSLTGATSLKKMEPIEVDLNTSGVSVSDVLEGMYRQMEANQFRFVLGFPVHLVRWALLEALTIVGNEEDITGPIPELPQNPKPPTSGSSMKTPMSFWNTDEPF